MKKLLIFFYMFLNIVNIYGTDTYVVGFDPYAPPFQYIENGIVKGFNIELLNRIGRSNDLKFKYVPINNGEGIEKLKNKEVDILMGIRFHKAEERILNFSESLIQTKACIVAPKNKVESIKNNLSYKHFLVAVEKDSIEYNYLNSIKRINFNTSFDQETVYDTLKLGRADFLVGIKEVMAHLLSRDKISDDYVFLDNYEIQVGYYLGTLHGNEALMEKIDKELKELKFNGTYKKLYNKWFANTDLVKQMKLVRNFKILTLTAAILLGILLLSFIWNLQLKKNVFMKTVELKDSNTRLEDKIVEIKNNNELNSLMCESSPRSIAIFDREGKVKFMNKNATLLSEVKGNFLGKNAFELPIIKEMIGGGLFEQTIYENKAHITHELEVVRDEKTRYYRYTMYPLLDYLKKNRGAFLTIEDVTEEKFLKERAIEREKNAAITNMISGIAHEIRNPLTSIKTYIELLPLKKDNEKFQNRLVTIVPAEVERVSKLIESLIDYSKPKNNHKSKTEVYTLINSSVGLLEPIAKKKGIEFLEFLDKTIVLNIDSSQIKQVLINVLLNSIQAIEEKMDKLNSNERFYVKISLYEDKHKIILEVEDNGIGMTDEEIENIFEIFYTTKIKGTGLGLPTSRQLVEVNGGKLIVESEKNKYTKIKMIFGGEIHE
ncbi:transporter substrate-binding domain-containing protein [Fusobacterium sp. MFO224]|uniref:transporter substrate-binding domain-containing protein n=1 Tax=Fusobacterium sp. MFO224 TaxID=3378070 RepID=UPI003854C6E8